VIANHVSSIAAEGRGALWWLIVWTEPRVNKSERKTSSLWAFRELETDVLGDDASKNGSNTGNSEEPWAK